jgi:hypothetical protein
MVAIVTLSVELLTVIVGAIVWKLGDICMSSQSFLSIRSRDFCRPTRETWRTKEKAGRQNGVRPYLIWLFYGLELTDECGTAIGPAAFSSSPRPMHWPELCPVQGMPPISGRPPTGAVLEKSGEFGTISGTQILVNWSSVSPPAHAETDGADVPFGETANIATAGAAAIATANPPARISRRVGRWKVAIVTLSVVCWPCRSRSG